LGRIKKIIIDDAFIEKWHLRYCEHDEKEYERIILAVLNDITRMGTISKLTLERIVNWKAARAKGYVKWKNFGKYKKAFRTALSSWEDQKIAILDDLPGVGIPMASTILHFIYPKIFPIVDFRTVEALQKGGYLDKSKSKYRFRDTIQGYNCFRRTILNIAQRCPTRSLREIDRALFAYHKIELDPKSKRQQT
jgi:hypothetical protein